MNLPKRSPLHLSALGYAVLAALSLAACLKGTVQLGTDTGSSSTSGSGNGNGSGSGSGNGNGGSGMNEQCGNGGSGFGGSGSNTYTYTDPPGLDTSKAVGDLTSEEATTWCTWFVGTAWNMGPAPHDAIPMPTSGGTSEGPYLKDGYVWGAEVIFTGQNTGICIQRVSVHDCVENLTVTHCGATVKALDDCVQSLVHGCPSELTWCNDYIGECDQTIVVRDAMGSPDDCHLPVQ